MEFLDVIALILFAALLVYNKFRLRLSPKVNWLDSMVWLSALVGIIPIFFSLVDILVNDPPGWIERLEFEEFFSTSALLLVALVLTVHQFEVEITSRYRRLAYLLATLTIVSGIIYLFSGDSVYWTATIVVYSVQGTATGLIVIKFIEEKLLQYLFVILTISFIFSPAIFFSTVVFYAAVLLYLFSVSVLEYLMISQYIFS